MYVCVCTYISFPSCSNVFTSLFVGGSRGHSRMVHIYSPSSSAFLSFVILTFFNLRELTILFLHYTVQMKIALFFGPTTPLQNYSSVGRGSESSLSCC